VEDGQRVATFARAECSVETHFDAILQLRLHPSGERFVSTDYCGSICLRELDSGKVLARHGEQPAPTDAILLPDATDQLCYADRHGHVHIWDFGKNELSRFGEDLRWYTGLAATPDGKYLAGSGYLAQVEVYRRDGQLQTVIPHDAGRLGTVSFRPTARGSRPAPTPALFASSISVASSCANSAGIARRSTRCAGLPMVARS
jgi:WD40 repeat protein